MIFRGLDIHCWKSLYKIHSSFWDFTLIVFQSGIWSHLVQKLGSLVHGIQNCISFFFSWSVVYGNSQARDWVWAVAATYAATAATPDPLTLARDRTYTSVATQYAIVGFLTHCGTTRTPSFKESYSYWWNWWYKIRWNGQHLVNLKFKS